LTALAARRVRREPGRFVGAFVVFLSVVVNFDNEDMKNTRVSPRKSL